MLRVVAKRLDNTNAKVSQKWQTYRKTKKKILQRKGLTVTEKKQILASELDLTRQRISEEYQSYRDYKHAKIYKSDYSDFYFTKQIKTENTIQKIFRAKKGFDTDNLDNVIPKILDNPKVKGVLVVFSVESEETGQKQYVSNYITAEVYDRLQENETLIFEYVAERLRAGNTKDYKLKFIYLRVIYENPKKSNK